MKVLITTTHLTLVGGVESYIDAIIPALQHVGHEVRLLTELPAALGRRKVGGSATEVPTWSAAELGEEAAVKVARKWSPDVIFNQGLTSPSLEQALLTSIAMVLYAHNYYGTCVSGNKRFNGKRPQPCNRTMGMACLVHYYPKRCGGISPLTMVRQYRRRRRCHALLSEFAAVVVASRHMREEYLRHGVAPERLQVVSYFPPGQEPDLEPPAHRTFRGRVLMVGRLTDVKGGELLIEALDQARANLDCPLTLTVAGDGPRREAMEALARRRGIRAHFCGWVSTCERIRLMREADVLAVPSVWPEPFGLVGIEAGCVGLPAVGFAVGGIPEWLNSGVSGELAPGDHPSPQGLADALVRAVTDEVHWNRLRTGAWETARRFTLEGHLERLIPILERACRGSVSDC